MNISTTDLNIAAVIEHGKYNGTMDRYEVQFQDSPRTFFFPGWKIRRAIRQLEQGVTALPEFDRNEVEYLVVHGDQILTEMNRRAL